MKTLALAVVIGFFLIVSGSRAANPIFDISALSFRSARIFYADPDAQYWNARTPKVLRREHDLAMVSRQPAYISRLYASMGAGRFVECADVRHENIYLIVEFDKGKDKEIFYSDGVRLFSENFKQCRDVGANFLRSFDAISAE